MRSTQAVSRHNPASRTIRALWNPLTCLRQALFLLPNMLQRMERDTSINVLWLEGSPGGILQSKAQWAAMFGFAHKMTTEQCFLWYVECKMRYRVLIPRSADLLVSFTRLLLAAKPFGQSHQFWLSSLRSQINTTSKTNSFSLFSPCYVEIFPAITDWGIS